MNRAWLESYPPQISPDINISAFNSLNELFARSCREFAQRPAFQNLGRTITFAELDALSRDFAAWLQAAFGHRSGGRVALMMPNVLQYPVALYGTLRAGMVVVNVNPLYTARELQHQLKDSGAEIILVMENFAHVVEKVLPHTPIRQVITTQIGDLLPPPRRALVNLMVKRVKKLVPEWSIPGSVDFRTVLLRGRRESLREAVPGHSDIAFLQYTGGTTGTSKGAILTHGNVIANVLQAEAWSRHLLEKGNEVAITALPLYHIFSLMTNCLLFTFLGGLNVLITNPRDMKGFVRELRRTPFTVMSGVNTLYNGLLNTPEFASIRFKKLKFAIGGGAAIHRSVAEKWRQVTGTPLIEGYGLTEASPFVACNLLTDPRPGYIGLPFPSTEVAILDDDGLELPFGSEGEICVRGPQIMKGYWQRPEETSAVLTSDGWLRTGDIGVMDPHGFLRVTDRKKDMILVSGFNVYPNEVEEVIAQVPGVLECAVIGVPNPSSGEVVKAYIVASSGELAADSVIAFCRQHLTNYKVPKMIEFRTELPKNPIGKVLRRELRTTDPDVIRHAKARHAEAARAGA